MGKRLSRKFKAAFRYAVSLVRAPQSARSLAARRKAVNEELRRYVTEQQLIRAVAEAVKQEGRG